MRHIDDDVFIADGAIVTGDVVIGEGSGVWYNAVIRGDNDQITIGKRTNIQDCCVLHGDVGDPIVIGDDVTVGHSAIIHGCTIGNNTLIGMGAIVMNNAVIGDNCIVGAGALVTGGTAVPDGSLVIGSPAKVKKQLTPEAIHGNTVSSEEYVELARRHREGKYMSKKLVKGLHHAAIRCAGEEQLKKAVGFYTDLLGFSVLRIWGSGKDAGAMVNCGNSIIEFFADAEPGRTVGPVDHIALATDDVDVCIDTIRKAGYRIDMEPNDLVIQSDPPFPARIAFCTGAAGESIEIFCEK